MNKDYMYAPKGGMCRDCVFKRSDCSKLKFENMRVIAVCDLSELNIVKCDKYQKSGK